VSAGEDGISRRNLLRMFRSLRKRDTDDLISTMVEEESIIVGRSVPRVGRPQVVYYASGTKTAREIMASPTTAQTHS